MKARAAVASHGPITEWSETPAARPWIEVLPSGEALMRAAAARFVAAAAGAIGARGRFAVALAGGATPRGLYALLATEAFARQVDWSGVHVFWSDERCVPPDDPASNQRMAREALLDRVPIPAANIHPIHGQDRPAAAAAACERDLRALFGTPAGPPRAHPGACFDLVLLGLGADGHTASLFSGGSALRERAAWALAQRVAAEPPWRVTLTPPVINAAAEVVFLVRGPAKAATLRRVLEGPAVPEDLPARAISPHPGRLVWLADAEAAAELAPAPVKGKP